MPKRVYDRAHASVRFCGPTLDPLTVTLALRLPPDHAHRDGEPKVKRRPRTGRVHEYAAHRGGMWSMSSKKWVRSPRLSVHLDWLLKELEPKAAEIAKLRKAGVEVDFFCYSSGSAPAPPALPRAIRERAAALGIEIVIDHYGPSTEINTSE